MRGMPGTAVLTLVASSAALLVMGVWPGSAYDSGTTQTWIAPSGTTGSPSPSPTPRFFGTWGDLDCYNQVDPVDALKGLRQDAGLEISQLGDCPPPGEFDRLFGQVFGDWDCSGLVDPVDALQDLRYDAGLEESQNDPCPPIGQVAIWRPGTEH